MGVQMLPANAWLIIILDMLYISKHRNNILLQIMNNTMLVSLKTGIANLFAADLFMKLQNFKKKTVYQCL